MKFSSKQAKVILGEAVHIAFYGCRKTKPGFRGDYDPQTRETTKCQTGTAWEG